MQSVWDSTFFLTHAEMFFFLILCNVCVNIQIIFLCVYTLWNCFCCSLFYAHIDFHSSNSNANFASTSEQQTCRLFWYWSWYQEIVTGSVHIIKKKLNLRCHIAVVRLSQWLLHCGASSQCGREIQRLQILGQCKPRWLRLSEDQRSVLLHFKLSSETSFQSEWFVFAPKLCDDGEKSYSLAFYSSNVIVTMVIKDSSVEIKYFLYECNTCTCLKSHLC